MIITGETGGIITSFKWGCLVKFADLLLILYFKPCCWVNFVNISLHSTDSTIFSCQYRCWPLFINENCLIPRLHFQTKGIFEIQMKIFPNQGCAWIQMKIFPNQGYGWIQMKIFPNLGCAWKSQYGAFPNQGYIWNSNENISKPRVCLNSNENISKPRVWLNSNENISKPRLCLKITIWWNGELIQSNSQCFGHFHNVDYNSKILIFVILN